MCFIRHQIVLELVKKNHPAEHLNLAMINMWHVTAPQRQRALFMNNSSKCRYQPIRHTGATFYINHMLRLLDYSYPLNWSYRAVYRHSWQAVLKKLRPYVILAFFYFSEPLSFPFLRDAISSDRTDVEKACLGSFVKIFCRLSRCFFCFCHYNNLKLTNSRMSSSDD